jgi:hypothetical protein
MPKLAILIIAASICLPVISGGTSPKASAREGAPNVHLADFRPLTQLQCRRHVPNAPPKSTEETQFA